MSESPEEKDFDEAWKSENENKRIDTVWRNTMFSSTEVREARHNIETNMQDILNAWQTFLSNPETIKAIKALPGWNQDEEAGFLEDAKKVVQSIHIQ